MKAQLAAMMSSTSAPGAEQAQRATEAQSAPAKPKTDAKPAPKKKSSAVKKSATPPAKAKPRTKRASAKKRAGEEKAEKVSVSLHPTDQDNAELIEDALRDAGLITRRAPISFLLKVALASFDPQKIDDLPEVVASIKARDGRGRWAQQLAGKNVK